MRKTKSGLLAIPMAALAACASISAPASAAPADAPDLLVVISVDQLSSELYRAYAPHMRGGFARIAGGTGFVDGYQPQAATETCPGHSTILTGALPARTGIVANAWFDRDLERDNKAVYCAEDPAASTGNPYVPSATHLLVPTLGELMKQADPASRNIAVSGKDRSALMMGGKDVDQRWFWAGKGFGTELKLEGNPKVVPAASGAALAMIEEGIPALELPGYCASWDKAYQIGETTSVGTGRLAVPPGSTRDFPRNPAYDGAVLALAAGLVDELKLGKGDAPDLLSIGLSATDYVGHAYGNRGAEMCLQMAGLDRSLGDFMKALDKRKLDYVIVLTADHGVLDVPPRLHDAGVGDAAYVSMGADFTAGIDAVKARFGVERPIVYGHATGDQYLHPEAYRDHGEDFREAVMDVYRAHPQVAAVLTSEEIMAQPIPTGDPSRWSYLERVRASFHPDRSGDFYVVLKDRIMPIAEPGGTYVATHGTVHDYDRRVPILFYRRGMPTLMRPDPASTTDIMPTLAAMIGLAIDPGSIDGKCIDGIAGAACP